MKNAATDTGGYASDCSAEQLLRAWYQWFCTDPAAPAHLPDNLHCDTAAWLAARAVENGNKIYNPKQI